MTNPWDRVNEGMRASDLPGNLPREVLPPRNMVFYIRKVGKTIWHHAGQVVTAPVANEFLDGDLADWVCCTVGFCDGARVQVRVVQIDERWWSPQTHARVEEAFFKDERIPRFRDVIVTSARRSDALPTSDEPVAPCPYCGKIHETPPAATV